VAKDSTEIMSGHMTLLTIERRKPNEVILEVSILEKKAYTFYKEFAGALRVHPRASSTSRVQRVILYALTGDVYYGVAQLGEFTYAVFKKRR